MLGKLERDGGGGCGKGLVAYFHLMEGEVVFEACSPAIL